MVHHALVSTQVPFGFHTSSILLADVDVVAVALDVALTPSGRPSLLPVHLSLHYNVSYVSASTCM